MYSLYGHVFLMIYTFASKLRVCMYKRHQDGVNPILGKRFGHFKGKTRNRWYQNIEIIIINLKRDIRIAYDF